MNLGYVIAYVNDPAASAAFYERAFGLERGMLDETGAYAEMKTGATTLAFTAHEFAAQVVPVPYARGGADGPAPSFQITLTADDVAAAYALALAQGATEASGPSQTPWGQTVAYVRDLDGIIVELATPMG